MANRKTRKIKNDVPVQSNDSSFNKTENINSSIQIITNETDYYRPIVLAIEQSSEGDFIFIESNTPVERKKIPEKIKNYGLKKTAFYIDINSNLPPSIPLHKSIPEWIKSKNIKDKNVVLILDSFDEIFRDREYAKEWLTTFNLSREALSNVQAILLFLIPTFCIEMIRQYAPDIWSWRAFHFQLPSKEEFGEMKSIQILDLTEYKYPEDNPERRESRIKVLNGLLEDELKLHDSIEAVWSNILSPLVNELFESARFSEALEVLSKAKQWINSFPNTAKAAEYYYSLGVIYHQLGNLDEAEKYFRSTLEIAEKIFGQEHPNVASTLNNIGSVLQDRGDLDGALDYYRHALEIGEKVYGNEHPNVAVYMNNMGMALKDKGNLDSALDYIKRALEINEKVYGKEYPDVARYLNNIGNVLWDKGNLDGSLEYLKRALEINEKIYGKEHPNVAIDLNNIGSVLRDKGNLDGSLEYLKRALEIDEKIYGKEHPNVATRLNNIGGVLMDKGDLEGARNYAKKAFSILVNIWGIENPKTKLILENYLNCGGNPDDLLKQIKNIKNSK